MFSKIDRLLRGGSPGDADGPHAFTLRSLVLYILVLGAIYGAFMGLFGAIHANATYRRLPLTSAIKVPFLILMTLGVTTPSFYVFATLLGARIELKSLLRHLLIAMTIFLAVLASLGPVTGFFTLSTESYGFMIFLNVFFFSLGGVIGLAKLTRWMVDLLSIDDAKSDFVKARKAPTNPQERGEAGRGPSGEAASSSPGDGMNETESAIAAVDPEQSKSKEFVQPYYSRRRKSDSIRMVLRVWCFLFAIVGAQMSWIMRPFIGDPKQDFEFFRDPESNFYAALWRVFVGFFN